ncbi:MAG: autotransporter-associated beta strand repeat-containing protein, partial [Pirellulaceae bacterium]
MKKTRKSKRFLKQLTRRLTSARRRLRIEDLEKRQLLAGDIHIGAVRPDPATPFNMQFLLDDDPLVGTRDASEEISFKFGHSANTPGGVGLNDVTLVGDFNNIGFDQAVTVRQLLGGLEWFGDTDRDTDEEYNFRFGLIGDTPLIGDFNGDGYDDIAAVRPNSGFLDWYVHYATPGLNPYPTNGSTVGVDASFTFGLATDTPKAGDFSGDGIADVTAVRDNGGTYEWYIHNADSPGNPYPVHPGTGAGQSIDDQYLFGSSSAIAIVGDWDNDGDDNVGVVFDTGAIPANPADWSLDTSDNGGAAEITLEYGIAGDQFVAGKWADRYWDGTGNVGGDGVNWSDANNWSNNTLPTTGDDVVIIQPGSVTSINHNSGINSIGSLHAGPGGAVQATGGSLTVTDEYVSSIAVNVGGGTLRLDGPLTTSLLLVNSSGKLQLGVDNALGSTSLEFSGGTVEAIGGAKTLSAPVTLSGDLLVLEEVTFAGPTTLTTTPTINADGAGRTLNLDGVVSDGGNGFGLTFAAGTSSRVLSLSAANTYTGTTTVNGGTLIVDGSISGDTVFNGGRLDVRNNTALGAGTLTINGGTLWQQAAPVVIPNNVTIGGDFGGNANVDLSGNITLAATPSITVPDGSAPFTISGNVGDGGNGFGLTVDALQTSRNVILSGTNTYTGATTATSGTLTIDGSVAGPTVVNGGTLTIGDNGALGAGTLTISDGVIQADGNARTINNSTTIAGDFDGGGDLTIAGSVTLTATPTIAVVSGSANPFVINGSITDGGNNYGVTIDTIQTSLSVELGGTNTYGGQTTVNSGTLRIGSTGAIPIDSRLSLAGNGTVELNGFDTAVGSLLGDATTNVNLGSNTLTVGGDNTVTFPNAFSGNISGTGGLTHIGTGEMTISSGTIYTGPTTVQSGAVLVIGTGSLGTTAAGTTVQNGAELKLGALTHNEPVTLEAGSTLSADGAAFQNGDIALAAAAVNVVIETFDSGDELVINGNITGTGSADAVTISKGTVRIEGNSSYLGGTTIQNSTLVVNGTHASSIVVDGGGTLQGSGTINAPVTALIGSTVEPGNSPGVTNTGDFDLQFGSTLEIEIGGTTPGNTATDHDQVNVTGSVTLGGTLDVSLFNSFTPSSGNTFTIINNDLADAVSGTFDGVAEGDVVTDGQYSYTVSYVGGDGNDVVLTTNSLTNVSIISTILHVTDSDGNQDNLSLSTTASHLVITETSGKLLSTAIAGASGSGTSTINVPFASFAGTIINVSTGGGDDSVTIDSGFSPRNSTGGISSDIVVSASGDGGNDTLIWNGADTLAGTIFNFDSINLNADATTAGTQTWDGAATLTTNARLTGSSVTLASTVDGAAFLRVSGNATFSGSIGSTTPLSEFRHDTGLADFNAESLTTTGDLTFAGNVILNSPTDVVTFNSTTGVYLGNSSGNYLRSLIDGEEALNINTPGPTFISAGIGTNGQRLRSLVTDAGGTVTTPFGIATTEDITFNDAVSSKLSSINGRDITFAGTLDGPSDKTTVVTATGEVTFVDVVGGTTAPRGISIVSSSGVTINDTFTIGVNGFSAVSSGTITVDGDIAATTTGAIALTTESNVLMTTPGWSITTVDGDITLNANQQAVQGSGDFYGVSAWGGTIAAAGNGNITINGRASIGGISRVGVTIGPDTTVSTNTGDVTIVGVGGTGTGAQHNGAQVHQGSVVESTGGGSIDITGTAGTEGYGVRVLFDGQVRTTGTGSVTLTGTGGAGTASGEFLNYGVALDLGTTGNGTAVSNTGSGTITINATAGNSAPAFFMGSGGTNRLGFDGINAYAGDIVINADTMDISDAIIQSSGDLSILPVTVGTSVGIGGGAGTLNIDAAEIAQLADGFNSITIGDANGTVVSQTFVDSGQSFGAERSDDILLGDLDGDGDLDAFAVNRTAASHTVWLNDGTGAFTDNAQNLATDTSF